MAKIDKKGARILAILIMEDYADFAVVHSEKYAAFVIAEHEIQKKPSLKERQERNINYE